MKAVIFACLAMFQFVFLNTVIEQKLATYTTAVLMMYVYFAALPLALGTIAVLKLTGQPVVAPSGSIVALTIAVGAGYYLADFCFFSAYTNGGSVSMVGTILLLFPVLASLSKFIWTGSLPNLYQVASYLCAAGAVWLAFRGSVHE